MATRKPAEKIEVDENDPRLQRAGAEDKAEADLKAQIAEDELEGRHIKLKMPPRGNRAAKDKDAADEQQFSSVPGPSPRDGEHLENAVECPVCQYRFDPADPKLQERA